MSRGSQQSNVDSSTKQRGETCGALVERLLLEIARLTGTGVEYTTQRMIGGSRESAKCVPCCTGHEEGP